MRILHLDSGREMRGGQWQVRYLIEGLAGKGHTGTLLAPRASPLFSHAAAAGFDVRPLGLLAIRRLAGEAAIVHAHSGRAHTLALTTRAAPLVVSRRVAFPVKRGLASRWKYRRARCLIAVSEHVKQTLLAAGIEESRVRVVYDGVPDLDPSTGRGGIISPATDDPRKGAALVREAAVIAGVQLTFSANLARELGDAAAFVYVTREEGLGSAVLLAMSAGVPVIASRVGGICEIIEDGVSGFLASNDAGEIAGLMRRLMNEPELRDAIGRRGRERVRERFSLETMVRRTLEIYREIVAC